MNTPNPGPIHLGDVLHRSLGLVGRGTLVAAASSLGGDDRKLVAKTSWLNIRQLSEQTIIEQAAKAHGVEAELGISENSRRPCRVFRIIILEHLYPITATTGLGRITALVQCVKCHYLAWEAGVQHRDLSLSNLMFREQEGKYLGVLNDWDLSFVEGLSSNVDEHTAMLPFLALDLLKPEYQQGKMAVEYRHELESFTWIIYWLAKCSESPDGKPPADLLKWGTSAKTCLKEKSLVVAKFRPADASKATVESRVTSSLFGDFSKSYVRRQLREMEFPEEPESQESNKSRFERFLQLVSNALPYGVSITA